VLTARVTTRLRLCSIFVNKFALFPLAYSRDIDTGALASTVRDIIVVAIALRRLAIHSVPDRPSDGAVGSIA